MKKKCIPLTLSLWLAAAAGLGAQDLPLPTPPSAQGAATQLGLEAPVLPGCNAEIRGNKPKVYIGNFFVTYGKKDMGKAIGDYMAERFQADGRFELVSRDEINEEMTPLLKKKNLKPGDYLTGTLALAVAKNADCVIFGKISKKGEQVSFLVRMASVVSGENVRKVDSDVERKDALQFLEGVGDQFVAYFVAAPPVVAQPIDEKPKKSGDKKFYLGGTGNFSLPFGFIKDGFNYGIGGEVLFGMRVGGFHLGVSGEYLTYVVKDTKFTGLTAMTTMGYLGYEIGAGKSFSVMPALYGGIGFGKLSGELESISYTNAQYAAGLRISINIGKSFAIIAEPRAVLKADSTYILSYTQTLGVLVRF